MSKLIGVGAKNPSNVWTALSVDGNGQLKTTKDYSATANTIIANESIRDTNAHALGSFDASEYSYASLRVSNQLDSDVTLYFYDDRTPLSTVYMKRNDGSYLSIAVKSKTYAIITPNDFPELPYMKHIKPIATCATTPTEGYLSVFAIAKK